jgi:hypothetical protein
VIFLEYGYAQEQIRIEEAARGDEGAGQNASRLVAAKNAISVTNAMHLSSIKKPKRPSALFFDEQEAALLVEGTALSDGAPKRRGKCDPYALVTAVALSQALSNVSTALVFVNMALMCLPYYGMSDAYALRLEVAASVIAWLFILEMGIKLLGLGCGGYWSDGWNRLDGTVPRLTHSARTLRCIRALSPLTDACALCVVQARSC